MNTILVPTDFSAPAKNAARFAIGLAKDLNAKKILFFNAYQAPPVLTEAAVPAMPIMDMETMKMISDEGMQQFKQSLQQECPSNIELDHKTDFSILSNDINEICKNAGAELIVMGITGTSKIEEVFIGSTATSVVKSTKVPVIIVPSDARYTSIKNIMLACDYKKVIETTPVQPIKNILDATKASLHIVNVYESDKEISADKAFQQELLQSMLKDHDPKFHFINNDDFITGINHFVETNGIDMIIAIPRKHRLFEGLFKERHSKILAFHSHVPLMYIHMEDL